jgi:hypothetical protein
MEHNTTDKGIAFFVSSYHGMLRFINAARLFNNLDILHKVAGTLLNSWEKQPLTDAQTVTEAQITAKEKNEKPPIFVREETRRAFVAGCEAVVNTHSLEAAMPLAKALGNLLNDERNQPYFQAQMAFLEGSESPQSKQEPLQGFSVGESHFFNMLIFVTSTGLYITEGVRLEPDSPFETAKGILHEFSNSCHHYAVKGHKKEENESYIIVDAAEHSTLQEICQQIADTSKEEEVRRLGIQLSRILITAAERITLTEPSVHLLEIIKATVAEQEQGLPNVHTVLEKER